MQRITFNVGSYKATCYAFKDGAGDPNGSLHFHVGKREWMPVSRVWTLAPALGTTKGGNIQIALAYVYGAQRSDSDDRNLWDIEEARPGITQQNKVEWG